MDKNPASKLRADSRHDSRQRQLPALVGLLGLILPGVPGWGAEPPATTLKEPNVREEVRAAKLMAAALTARQAGPNECRKLDGIYAELAKKYPRDATVPNARAEFLWSIGDQPQAVEQWLAAEQLDPKSVVVLDHLGEAYLSAGDGKKAAGYYRRAATQQPNEASYHYSYANVAFLFRRELTDDTLPTDADVVREALAHFGEAARLQPLDPEYAKAYAETFYVVAPPDWPAALKAWSHFLEISPQKDFAHLNLARIHIQLGNKAEAQASLDQIQNPEFDRVKAKLKAKFTEKIGTE